MRKSYLFQYSLVVATLGFFGCSASEDYQNVRPPEGVSTQKWTVAVNAANDSIGSDGIGDEVTRAVFYGGNTRRYAMVWDQGDKVAVYRSGSTESLGDIVPQTYASANTVLSGDLTGSFSDGEELSLFAPQRRMFFTGQTGKIQDLSSKYCYRTSTTHVLGTQENSLSLSDVLMTHRVTYLRVVLMNETGDQRLHAKTLEIHSTVDDKIVEEVAVDGTVTPCSSLTVNAEKEDGEYPAELFVSMLNTENESIGVRMKATLEDGSIWVGPIAGRSPISFNPRSIIGQLSRLGCRMLETSPATSLTVADIPDQTFTGYDITPAVTVTDGEDELMLNSDYSASYANNVNVGEATATVTGLADAGAVAATKYLGTKDKTFNIVKATPVMEMMTTDMHIVAGHEGQTRTVTRVFIDNNGNGTWDEGTDYDITSQVTVSYASDNTGVATVDSATGAVTPAASPTNPTTATITASIANGTNWNSQSISYTVNVETEVNGQNTVNPWDNGGSEDDKIYVQ